MTPPAGPLVITATPTLFTAEGDLAEEEIHRHIEWLREKGVDALFPAGTSGEFPTLTDDERIRILDIALQVFPADRVYIHVGAAGTRQAVGLVRRAVDHGATKMAAITPFFQPAPEAQVLGYYEQLVSDAREADVFAYLFKARTSTVSTPSILSDLADLGVAGVKISGETDESVASFLAARPDGFTLFSGNDVSFGQLIQAGGHGIVSGVSSAYPEPFVALRDALSTGDSNEIALRQADVVAAVAAVRAGSLTHLKAGIAARGFGASPVRSAVAPVDAQDAARITQLAAVISDAPAGELATTLSLGAV
ncbi:dihydrodipicolinate synthase family protein [Arthrobacter sp. MDT2-16]